MVTNMMTQKMKMMTMMMLLIMVVVMMVVTVVSLAWVVVRVNIVNVFIQCGHLISMIFLTLMC